MSKKIGILIIIAILIFLACNYKGGALRKPLDKEKIIEVQIIDKYGNMEKLYEDPEKEEYVLADIVIDGNYYKNIGIRTKGSFIYETIKELGLNNYSFKIKLDYFNKTQNYNGITEIHLNSTSYDKTGIREYLVYEIYNKMGIETHEYALGHLKIDNLDRGLITIVEVINENYVAQKYNSDEGNLYKPTYVGADLRYNGENFKKYTGILENTRSVRTTTQDKERLINIIKNISDSSTATIENNFMDFDKIVKMVAVNKVLFNVDVFTSHTLRNYYIYEEKGKIDLLTFDFDISMNPRINLAYWTDDMNEFDLSKSDIKIYSRITEIIIENEEYNKKYYQYVAETQKLLRDIDIENFIDQIYKRTRAVMKLNERKVYSDYLYEEGVVALKNFLVKRGNAYEIH